MAANQKVSCNTSISAQLIIDAKELKLSPSAILEEALSKAVKEAKHARWLQENQQGIAEHNRKIQSQGTFSEMIKQL
jgi:antitoxin CcdA